jgi:hypothetical protein
MASSEADGSSYPSTGPLYSKCHVTSNKANALNAQKTNFRQGGGFKDVRSKRRPK